MRTHASSVLSLVALLAVASVAAAEKPRVLYLTHSAGFVHSMVKRPSEGELSYSAKKVKEIAGDRFTVDCTKDCSAINAENLDNYDAVLFYMSGNLPISDSGRAALMRFVRSGHGFAGVHSATDTGYKWSAYGKMIGGYFDGHPWHQKVRIAVETPGHPTVGHLGKRFVIGDEIYQFKSWSRRNVDVLLRLDSSYGKLDVSEGKRSDDDYAVSWVNRWGQGRVFYTSLGHDKKVWDDERFQKHLKRGLLWAMGPGATGSWDQVATPFNGENLDGWKLKGPKERNHWRVGTAAVHPDDPTKLKHKKDGTALVNTKANGVNLYSTFHHGDAVVEIDVMVPEGANSGIYLQGDYEVQVLDSHGKEEIGMGDMGAIFGAKPPTDPRYEPAGTWQTYQIHFRAPRFNDDGEKVANARFEKVILNGKVIQRNIEMPGPTPGGLDGEESAKGPLLFQGNHDAVAYRNLRVWPLE